jgi:cell wall-associated NlpC family hydrolase
MTFAPRAALFAAICMFLAALAVASVCATGKAWAQPQGGISAVTPEPAPPPSTETPAPAPAGSTGAAALVGGRAIAPIDAPAAVKRVIAAANKIRAKPYIWGGGHGRWWDRGYDCSGSVSFALHGGEFLTSPLPSGPMESWGSPGAGAGSPSTPTPATPSR